MAISLHTVLPASYDSSSPTNYIPRYNLPSAPNSLAILGPLPGSSAVHIALGLLSTDQPGDSHDKDGSKGSVLILSKNENEWSSALMKDGNLWFKTEAGRARLSKTLDRVKIRYAPTATHLALLLSLLSTDDTLVSDSTRKPIHIRSEDPTRLESFPRLIILHELSSFFGGFVEQDGDHEPEWRPRPTVDQSQYGSLLTLAISTVDHLNERRPPDTPATQLLLLDAQALSISLPIIIPPIDQPLSESDPFTPSKRKRDTYPKLDVRVLVESFVDWVGIIQPLEHTPSPTEQRPNLPTHQVIVPSLIPSPTAPAETRANVSAYVDTFWFCGEGTKIKEKDTRDEGRIGSSPHETWVWCDGP
ncbi:hypothetical protein [Phaffia rhodozyma]|uniref:Uncharacterized protein n=1 Tax=Phaffia rhodozyma TaxID=264483 RepID=A0A0F7STR7_PHARH|nr:hypothetical protein [Phaffia rhodozyma]